MAAPSESNFSVYAGTSLEPRTSFNNWSAFERYAFEHLAPGGIADLPSRDRAIVRCPTAWRSALSTLRDIFESASDDAVMILGETGVGKEYFARLTHIARYHREPLQHPFVVAHLPSYSPELLQAELFGHEEGAFTGATKKRIGLLAQASKNGGTLFLDEIGDVDAVTQSKLIRVVESKVYSPVGSFEQRSLKAMVVSATNKALNATDRSGQRLFRDDLEYRLSQRRARIPALRDRLADVQHILRAMDGTLSRQSMRTVERLVPESAWLDVALKAPGNLRGLRVLVRTLARALRRHPDSPERAVVQGSLEWLLDFVSPSIAPNDLGPELEEARRTLESGLARLNSPKSARGKEAGPPSQELSLASLPSPFNKRVDEYLTEVEDNYYRALRAAFPKATVKELATLIDTSKSNVSSKLNRAKTRR